MMTTMPTLLLLYTPGSIWPASQDSLCLQWSIIKSRKTIFCSSLPSLWAFHDTLEQHMRALSSLGRSSESYGPLLTTSVLNKLPPEIKKQMARDYHDSECSIEDDMSGLFKEIQILEMSHQYTGKPGMHGSIPPPTALFSTHIDRVSQPRSSQQRK